MELVLSPSGRQLEAHDSSGNSLYEVNPIVIPLKYPLQMITSICVRKAVIPRMIDNIDYWPEMPGNGYTFYWEYKNHLNNPTVQHLFSFVIPPKNYYVADFTALANSIIVGMDNAEDAYWHGTRLVHWGCTYVTADKHWKFYVNDNEHEETCRYLRFDYAPALAKFFGFWPQWWGTSEDNNHSFNFISQQEVDDRYFFPEVYLVINEIETERSVQKSFQSPDNVVAALVFDYPAQGEFFLTYLPSLEKEVVLGIPQNLTQLTVSFKILLGGYLWCLPFHCEEWYLELYVTQITSQDLQEQQNLY